MKNCVSQKTVFVLDHTLNGLSGVDVDMESLCKSRGGVNPGQSTLRPATKTIWTCAVEAITEYCRIVWDIFPGSRFVSFNTVSGSGPKQLAAWDEDQSLSAVMQNLLMLGAAQRGTPDLLAGCAAALRALTQPTPPQLLQQAAVNKGRVIIVSKLLSDQKVKFYYQKFCELVNNVNRSLAENDLPLAHVNLVFLSFIGKDEVSCVTGGSLSGGGSTVTGDVVEFRCGPCVAAKLCSLVVRHYNLASTTVTGIPMKEEQNALSSANYDVELFHPAEAHAATIGDESIRTTRQDTDYPTVTLKWCTPRTNASHELHQCSTAFRITSVDVNSRPSSCLTNFLLNGRWVMLESPKRTAPNHSTRILSHMLAAHGGDIYIHTLLTARTVLEDPPSISEGQGGKVTDYRIPDFANLIRANLLVPHGPNGLALGKSQLEKHTKHWPITLSQTAFFSLGTVIEPLSRAIVHETMTEEQVFDSKQVVISLMNMEMKGENLNISHARTKGSKKEDQYRAMWNELEHFLRQQNSSSSHQKVLDCFLQCHSKEPTVITIGQDTPMEESVDIDQALKELDLPPNRNRATTKRKGNGHLTSENANKKWLSDSLQKRGGNQSLLSMFQQKIKNSESKGSPQFVGRLKAENNVTKLYVNLQKDKDKDEMPSTRRK